MEHADIYDALRGRILEILDVDPDLVTPDARLSDTLEADSVDLIEIGGTAPLIFHLNHIAVISTQDLNCPQGKGPVAHSQHLFAAAKETSDPCLDRAGTGRG